MSGIHRIELEPAYVLHTRNFRESSLIVEALARDHGRLGLVARGARRPKSRLRGLLQQLIQPLPNLHIVRLTGQRPR